MLFRHILIRKILLLVKASGTNLPVEDILSEVTICWVLPPYG